MHDSKKSLTKNAKALTHAVRAAFTRLEPEAQLKKGRKDLQDHVDSYIGKRRAGDNDDRAA